MGRTLIFYGRKFQLKSWQLTIINIGPTSNLLEYIFQRLLGNKLSSDQLDNPHLVKLYLTGVICVETWCSNFNFISSSVNPSHIIFIYFILHSRDFNSPLNWCSIHKIMNKFYWCTAQVFYLQTLSRLSCVSDKIISSLLSRKYLRSPFLKSIENAAGASLISYM